MSELNIKPGSTITLTVVKYPTNLAARKTLQRLLGQDKDHAIEQRRLKKVYKSNFDPQPRGGRLYAGRLVKQHPLKGTKGEQGTIRATPSVMRDLPKVSRFVEIKSA